MDAAGTEHRVVAIDAPDAIEAIRRFLADRPVVIADGHHRYETALAYRDERRAAARGTDPDAPLLFAGDGLDAGGGRASTVVDLTGAAPRVLRWGAVSHDMLEPMLLVGGIR